MKILQQRIALGLTLVVGSLLALPVLAADATVTPFSASAPGKPPAAWRFVTLPNKPDTQYGVVDLDGKRVLKVEAVKSYGNLIHELHVTPTEKATVKWRWRVEKLVEGADLTAKSGDDTAAKLCLSFGFPSDKLSFGERAKLGLARTALGEDIPTQTLCYMWDNKIAAGTTMVNAFSRRIRMMVLQSGPDKLGQWVNERRNITADYKKAFGDESDSVPEITAIIIGADADNTGGASLAYFEDAELAP